MNFDVVHLKDLSLEDLEVLWSKHRNNQVRTVLLIKLWKNGERKAGDLLWSLYDGYIRSICCNFGVMREDDINDVKQELALDLQNNLANVLNDIKKSFSGYLWGRVRKAISKVRSMTNPKTINIDETGVSESFESKFGIARFELKEIIDNCQGKLTNLESLIFELKFKDGLTLNEISDKIQRSYNAVAQNIFRMALKMKECLEIKGIHPSIEVF